MTHNLILSGMQRLFRVASAAAVLLLLPAAPAAQAADPPAVRAALSDLYNASGGDTVTITLPGGVPIVLVRIPAGTFMMGSPVNEEGRFSDEDLHEVTLTQSYYVGKYEVTQAQWLAVMGSPMVTSCGSYGTGDDYPVFCVSWDDICGGSTGSDCPASSFVGKLNAYLGTTSFRLPTEAEWERAARAGTQTAFSFGVVGDSFCSVFDCNSCGAIDQYVWWCGNDSPLGAKRVGSKLPNAFGLYDMSGNVYEWVADWYGSYPSVAVTDPAGPLLGSLRVSRGGDWNRSLQYARSAARDYGNPTRLDSGVGFRLAASPGVPDVGGEGLSAYMIPASAHIGGLSGTSWVSDVVLQDPGTGGAHADLYFLGSGSSWPRRRGVSILAGQSLKLGDIVGETFGQSSASGALLVVSDQPLVVTSRTYNDASSGTYGQFIAGVSTSRALGTGEQARLIQLTRNNDYRTNIGFANATDETLNVKAKLYKSNGDLIATRSYTIQPYGFYQKTDIIGTDVSDAYAVVSSSAAGAQFFTYASIIDNRTGDPVFVTPDAGTAQAGQSLYIPGSAHITGTGGTQWRSDVEVHNPGSTTAAYKVELLKRDQANPSPQSKSFNLAPGRSVRYTDALSSLFGFTGAAALRITPSSGTITVSSRTYNQTSGGTYGQFIPAAPASAAIGAGESVPLVQLAESTSTSSGYRTNIGFLNTSDTTITVQAHLFYGTGIPLGSKTVSLGAYEYQQVDRIFRSVTSFAVDNGYAILSTATSGGAFLAYGSVVDNSSGDPVYVPAAGAGGGS